MRYTNLKEREWAINLKCGMRIKSINTNLNPFVTNQFFKEFFDESSYRVAIGLAKFQDSTSVIFIHYQDIEFIIFVFF